MTMLEIPWAWVLATYLVGIAVAALVEDDPWPGRLGIAALWPAALAALAVVLALVASAALIAWRFGPLLLAGGITAATSLWLLF